MQTDYLVLKWEDIEEHLNDEELETFYDFLAHITNDTAEDDYIVINKKLPYAERVQEITAKNEKAITRDETIARLKELSELGDVEVAHCEADELLVNYINDSKITKAFEEVSKWYS